MAVSFVVVAAAAPAAGALWQGSRRAAIGVDGRGPARRRGQPDCNRRARTHLRPMPLGAVSLLFHAYVGWRLAPALGSFAAAVALVALLVVSALTLPYGL